MVTPTIATRSYPKRQRVLSRVLGRIAACRNNRKKSTTTTSSKKRRKKKKQTSAAEPRAPSTKSLSLSSQQESSCCSSSHNGSATTWDESSSNSNSKASATSPCTSPEYSQPVLSVTAEGFPALPVAPALAQPLLLGATESEVDAETLLFTAKETSSVMTDASCQDDCESKESSSEDEMLGMEVKVSSTPPTEQGDDQSQDGEDCLLVSPHEVGTAQVAPSSSPSPNMIYCPEDASSQASSNSSTGSYSSQLYPRSYYSSSAGDEMSASSILLESVDQAKVTKFTKFLQKARAQPQETPSAAPAGSIKEFYAQPKAVPARLPEVNVVMPDIIKLPPTESSSTYASSASEEDVEDKLISFLVLFCIAFLLWLAQEALATAAPIVS